MVNFLNGQHILTTKLISRASAANISKKKKSNAPLTPSLFKENKFLRSWQEGGSAVFSLSRVETLVERNQSAVRPSCQSECCMAREYTATQICRQEWIAAQPGNTRSVLPVLPVGCTIETIPNSCLFIVSAFQESRKEFTYHQKMLLLQSKTPPRTTHAGYS